MMMVSLPHLMVLVNWRRDSFLRRITGKSGMNANTMTIAQL